LFYVKDFSEISHNDRAKLLKQCLEFSKSGGYSILVANTGALTQAFRATFDTHGENLLIDMLDNNSSSIKRFGNNEEYSVRVINIATLDNSGFIKPYMENICAEDNWAICNECGKKSSCPIAFNVNLLRKHLAKAVDFITKHYIYQQEYGNRMTIRNVSAHLTFAITGGLECSKVENNIQYQYIFKHLFSNNFFGYEGFSPNTKFLKIKAINETYRCNYEVNKIYADETLFINRDFSKLPMELQSMVDSLQKDNTPTEIQFEYAIKRMYYLFNLETDSKLTIRLTSELFSKYFNTWLDIKKGTENIRKQEQLIFDVLSVLFTGSVSKRDFPITMKRENAMIQDVQCMYGIIRKKDIKLETETLGMDGCENTAIYICIDGKRINYPITLPLMDYFNDLLDGVITTDINPLLSQGIDSIKSQCTAYCEPSNDDNDEVFSLKILHNDKELEFEKSGDCYNIKVQ
jgi:hypothetical protein